MLIQLLIRISHFIGCKCLSAHVQQKKFELWNKSSTWMLDKADFPPRLIIIQILFDIQPFGSDIKGLFIRMYNMLDLSGEYMCLFSDLKY